MEEKKIMIDVNNVTIRFNLSNQKINSLKEYFIKLVKKELMFQEFFAVKDVSFKVAAGEAWALVGVNGSGKSTLLKAISGIIKPYKGSIGVNGSVSPLIELGAGFDMECTARENIMLNGCILGHSEAFMKKHFDEIVDFAEIHDFLDSPLKNYSSGMRARLGFSVATVTKPDILIVDEILAVGDYKFRKKCEARMKELLSEGTTLLFVSHNINDVKRLCDHALWIDKGICKMQGEVNKVCDAYMTELEKSDEGRK
ncbi:MAG: ABC transporter ATP-binding protein [Firmicutes bacterium]|nr:ABC transporter ATP-binding protein [Bacillota bacterium]